jgi:hypothetical protein
MFNIINLYMSGFIMDPINDWIVACSHPTESTQIIGLRFKRMVNNFISVLQKPINFLSDSSLG